VVPTVPTHSLCSTAPCSALIAMCAVRSGAMLRSWCHRNHLRCTPRRCPPSRPIFRRRAAADSRRHPGVLDASADAAAPHVQLAEAHRSRVVLVDVGNLACHDLDLLTRTPDHERRSHCGGAAGSLPYRPPTGARLLQPAPPPGWCGFVRVLRSGPSGWKVTMSTGQRRSRTPGHPRLPGRRTPSQGNPIQNESTGGNHDSS
jgi:hypothetical protein